MRTQKEINADPGQGMLPEQLDCHFNPDGDGQHPYFTRSDWRNEVEQFNTISGYWDWLSDALAGEKPKDAS